ncbi:MAG: DNA translocase FtsK [Candidatus Omnitrophica bacterium]|nr:DNA translocase FtsK [Candidatus Omnitrophota bacterium]
MEETHKRKIWAIVFIALSVFVFLSLISYNPADLSINAYPNNIRPENLIGTIGAWSSDILFKGVGRAAYLIPLLTFLWAISRLTSGNIQKLYVKVVGVALLFAAASSLLYINTGGSPDAKFASGGFIGYISSRFLLGYFNNVGTHVILITVLSLSLLLATEFLVWDFFTLLLKVFKGKIRLPRLRIPKPTLNISRRRTATAQRGASLKVRREAEQPDFIINQKEVRSEPEVKINIPKISKRVEKPKTGRTAAVSKVKKEPRSMDDYKLPTIDLLDSPPPFEERKIEDNLKINSRILEETLMDFGIEVRVVRVNRGPVITRYELEPAPGVKVNRISSLSDDISLAMKAQSVRIVAPLPGKGTVGVEIPNSTSVFVYIREILETNDYKSETSKLKIIIGKEISGAPIIADLGDMPHLLIAGATGSGKTVCVNALITSMLFTARPDEVKFLMVDPKMVELALFNGLPHLLCPVVTEAKKVSAALDWVVNEMERRYKALAAVAARNIDSYNEKIKAKDLKTIMVGEEEQLAEKMPYIVVIIDELADLMVVAQQEIENAITRLAQLSRAVGIHLVLATQRPSVDVITGVIKANFPSRISFKVASKVDSRTVLDMNGADKLLGKGDLLFMEPGNSKPIRAQGALISDKELERVVEFIKAQQSSDYNEEILQSQTKKGAFKQFEKDEVYEEAVRVILQTKQASVSMLQRRLGLGYTRAARIIDMMEDEGIVGPYQGSKPRDILIDTENIDNDNVGVTEETNQV